MVKNIWEEASQAQLERLAYIDFRLTFLGDVSRKNLMSRFGIKEAAATRDFALYKQGASSNLVLDDVSKIYVRTDNFVSAFQYSAVQALAVLSQGLCENATKPHNSLISCEMPSRLNIPSLDILSVVSRAIYMKKVVKINYHSIKNGQSTREIIPFSLVDNGLRWHVRAFDRKRKVFTDFVLTRISKANIINSYIEDNEYSVNDIQWNRIVELELSVHPRLKYPRTIELDYGMSGGLLKINVRAALVGYILRLWNVDCSPDHHLDTDEIHLWLRNAAALYGVDSGVENLLLAPGYQPSAF